MEFPALSIAIFPPSTVDDDNDVLPPKVEAISSQTSATRMIIIQ